MLDPPDHVTADQVLARVRAHWPDGDPDAITHLPVGFGAHHWRVQGPGTDLFVTLDALGSRHTRETLESAYSTANELSEQGLEFVLSGTRSTTGCFAVPFDGNALSAVSWHDGASGSEPQTVPWARRLARLHAATPPRPVPVWEPLIAPDAHDLMASTVGSPWPDPFGETARRAVRGALGDVERWVGAYHRLARSTDPDSWVVTHGEPHAGNILRTEQGELLVDWESVKLAPKERDFAPLLADGTAWFSAYGITAPDWSALEMFDLEWRLDEIIQYAGWFRQPHTGNASDRTALEGLLEEIGRPDWTRPRSGSRR